MCIHTPTVYLYTVIPERYAQKLVALAQCQEIFAHKSIDRRNQVQAVVHFGKRTNLQTIFYSKIVGQERFARPADVVNLQNGRRV